MRPQGPDVTENSVAAAGDVFVRRGPLTRRLCIHTIPPEHQRMD